MALTAMVMMAIILGASGLLISLNPEPPASQAEVAANCSSNKFAQNETAAGALTCGLPLTISRNQGLHSCTLTTVSTVATGFNIAYTTQANTQGTILVVLGFQVTEPSVAAPPVTTGITMMIGTGTAPTCGASSVGNTLCSATYTFSDTPTGIAGKTPMALVGVCVNLIASTAYWIDLQVTDSTIDSWVFLLRNVGIVDT